MSEDKTLFGVHPEILRKLEQLNKMFPIKECPKLDEGDSKRTVSNSIIEISHEIFKTEKELLLLAEEHHPAYDRNNKGEDLKLVIGDVLKKRWPLSDKDIRERLRKNPDLFQNVPAMELKAIGSVVEERDSAEMFEMLERMCAYNHLLGLPSGPSFKVYEEDFIESMKHHLAVYIAKQEGNITAFDSALQELVSYFQEVQATIFGEKSLENHHLTALVANIIGEMAHHNICPDELHDLVRIYISVPLFGDKEERVEAIEGIVQQWQQRRKDAGFRKPSARNTYKTRRAELRDLPDRMDILRGRDIHLSHKSPDSSRQKGNMQPFVASITKQLRDEGYDVSEAFIREVLDDARANIITDRTDAQAKSTRHIEPSSEETTSN